jgi:acetylornithine deacetylase
MNVKETLADLVSINSVSALSNGEIVSYLEARCQAMGFNVRRYQYRDSAGIEKINLICTAGAQAGNSSEVELALVGHTDTVPFDPNWIEATRLVENEQKLFGRGSCDTKGFIAAALTAVERVDLNRLKKPLALIFTADEEVGLFGAKKLAAEKPLRIRYSIIGEPTSLQPIHAGKGYCLAEVIVRGREGHSAYPALGKSAIFRAARLVLRLEEIAQRLREDRDPGFDPAFTTLNVGLIRGGTAKNVIAGECRFTLEWRPIPGQDPSKLLALLNDAIAAEQKTDPDFDCEVDAGRADSGFDTPRNSPLVTFLENITGQTAGTVAFGTEAAPMTQLGADSVVLGPGDIRVAHQTGEFVPVAQLEACVAILHQSIQTFCYSL